MNLVALHGGQGAALQYVLIAAAGEVLVAEAKGHFVHEVEAQRVGQLVEARLTGVVAQAHVVNRCLLHQPHVLQREVVADDLHRLWVGAVGIDAAQLDGPSVQLQHVAVDGYLAYANLLGDGLQQLVLLPYIYI